jgi:pyridoxamine 5'-phosphate oxidase-like protein
MEVTDFSEIEDEFIRRVHTMIWCNVATVDNLQRPRSRILHPIWEGATGWIATHRNSYKNTHLAHNPYVSLAYITDIHKPVYVDCTAAWVEERDQKVRIWDLFKNTPPPLGYDPATDFVSPDHDNFGLLKLTPWRIALVTFPAESHATGQRIWHRHDTTKAQY